nr:MAG TPA: Head fiber protein [Caudoviricetes sp.]
MAWLDYDGLLYFWQKIKSKLNGKVDKVTGKGLSTNDYTTGEKQKLAGLSNYTHPTSSGNKHIPAGGSAGQFLKWSADGTAVWANDNNTTYTTMTGATANADGKEGLAPKPAKGQQGLYLRGDGTWATPTNTTYGNATTSAAGLMSSGDKTKLDGIATGANNYVHPTTAGNKHVPAGGAAGQILGWGADGTAKWVDEKDTTYGTFKGATSSADGGNGLVPGPKMANKDQFLKGDGTWGTPTNTTYNDATQSTHGLMTAADKKKLDGVAAGANNYVHPSYTAKASGLYKVTVDASGHVSAATAVAKADITALGIPATNTTYSKSTSSTDGLMSKEDKTKLDAFGAASTYASKTYVGQQISAAGHIKKSIVDTLPAVSDAQDNIIYMVKKVTPDGTNLYDEYMLISGAMEKIGDTKTVIEAITNTEIDTILAS